MSNSVTGGKPRKRNRTGDIVGPYVVEGPVGANWRTTVCWRLKCPVCGHAVAVDTAGLNAARYRQSCGGCGVATGVAISTEGNEK